MLKEGKFRWKCLDQTAKSSRLNNPAFARPIYGHW